MQKQFQAEVARLEVSLKRAELRMQSQEQTIEQKVRVLPNVIVIKSNYYLFVATYQIELNIHLVVCVCVQTKQNQELESICDELLSKVKSAR